MGLSETIVAAIIGALATMATAIVQLVRNRAPSDGRPKPKKSRMRSALATIALMIGCIVGGYAWSALRAVSAKEELTATMQAEFSRQFAEFAAKQGQAGAATNGVTLAARAAGAGVAEALAHLPPCHISAQSADAGPVACNESMAQPSRCARRSRRAPTPTVRVQARVPKSESAWLERDAGAPTLGSLHIGAAPPSIPIEPELRSVCLDVSNWSVEDTLAVALSRRIRLASAPAASSRPPRHGVALARLLRDVEVGDRPFEDLGRQPDGFRQRRVRMDREADVVRVRAHLDGQRDLRDQLARVRTHHAAAPARGASPGRTVVCESPRRGPVRANVRSPARESCPS
jgi:hypothetical protein